MQDIKVRINKNESCDECDDDPEIVEGLYKGKVVYSMCMHDPSDYENIKDDIISTVEYMIENGEIKK